MPNPFPYHKKHKSRTARNPGTDRLHIRNRRSLKLRKILDELIQHLVGDFFVLGEGGGEIGGSLRGQLLENVPDPELGEEPADVVDPVRQGDIQHFGGLVVPGVLPRQGDVVVGRGDLDVGLDRHALEHGADHPDIPGAFRDAGGGGDGVAVGVVLLLHLVVLRNGQDAELRLHVADVHDVAEDFAVEQHAVLHEHRFAGRHVGGDPGDVVRRDDPHHFFEGGHRLVHVHVDDRLPVGVVAHEGQAGAVEEGAGALARGDVAVAVRVGVGSVAVQIGGDVHAHFAEIVDGPFALPHQVVGHVQTHVGDQLLVEELDVGHVVVEVVDVAVHEEDPALDLHRQGPLIPPGVGEVQPVELHVVEQEALLREGGGCRHVREGDLVGSVARGHGLPHDGVHVPGRQGDIAVEPVVHRHVPVEHRVVHHVPRELFDPDLFFGVAGGGLGGDGEVRAFVIRGGDCVVFFPGVGVGIGVFLRVGGGGIRVSWSFGRGVRILPAGGIRAGAHGRQKQAQ